MQIQRMVIQIGFWGLTMRPTPWAVVSEQNSFTCEINIRFCFTKGWVMILEINRNKMNHSVRIIFTWKIGLYTDNHAYNGYVIEIWYTPVYQRDDNIMGEKYVTNA